jgi:hypothetical protein
VIVCHRRVARGMSDYCSARIATVISDTGASIIAEMCARASVSTSSYWRAETCSLSSGIPTFHHKPCRLTEMSKQRSGAVVDAGVAARPKNLRSSWASSCSSSNCREWEVIPPGQIQWKARGTTREALQAVFDGEGTSEIPLSAPTTNLQCRILAEPYEATRWRLELAELSSITCEPTEPIDKSSATPAAQTFLDARRHLFAAIRGDDDLVVEACDLHRLRDSVIAYAESYTELLTWELRRAERDAAAFTALSRLLSIDTATVYFTDGRRTGHQAILVAPTHPLRLLWLVTWAELGLAWLAKGDAAHLTNIRDAAETLLHELSPLGFPIAVPQPDGRLTMAAGNLSPFWGVHLPSGTTNPQGALAELAAALGVTIHAGTTVSGRDLANRVERYLRLHPYVHSLTIAAVNPGRGDLLATMLTDLQRRPALADINYDLRLFVPDPEASGAGRALADLLTGANEVTSVGSEAFHTLNLGLVPKLSVAVRPLDEFRSASSAHAAHITVLFDAFSGERFNTTATEGTARVPVHGLVQDMIVHYSSTDDAVGWRKYPRHGRPAPLEVSKPAAMWWRRSSTRRPGCGRRSAS